MIKVVLGYKVSQVHREQNLEVFECFLPPKTCKVFKVLKVHQKYFDNFVSKGSQKNLTTHKNCVLDFFDPKGVLKKNLDTLLTF